MIMLAIYQYISFFDDYDIIVYFYTNHWMLGVIHPNNGVIKWFDSLENSPPQTIQDLIIR